MDIFNSKLKHIQIFMITIKLMSKIPTKALKNTANVKHIFIL